MKNNKNEEKEYGLTSKGKVIATIINHPSITFAELLNLVPNENFENLNSILENCIEEGYIFQDSRGLLTTGNIDKNEE